MGMTSGRVGVNKTQVDNIGMLKVATPQVIGGVQPVDKTAEMTQPVGVAPDGKLYTYPDSTYTLPISTETTLGGVKVGEGLDIDNDGVLAVDKSDLLLKPTTQEEVLVGVTGQGEQENVSVGAGLSLNNGVLSADAYELPIASATDLGGIKVGNGLTIDNDGVLSASGGGSGSVIGTATRLYPMVHTAGNISAETLNLPSTQGQATYGDLFKLSEQISSSDWVGEDEFDFIYLRVAWNQSASSSTYPMESYGFFIPCKNISGASVNKVSKTMMRISNSGDVYLGVLSLYIETETSSGDLEVHRLGIGHTSTSSLKIIKIASAGGVTVEQNDGGWLTFSNIYGIKLNS